MLVKEQSFKKLIKDAYTAGGLRVWNHNGVLTIMGSYWVIWTNLLVLPKECKGALIALCEEIPSNGTGYIARKKEVPQYEIEPGINLEAHIAEVEDGDEITQTEVVLNRPLVDYRVYQDCKKKVTLINEKFTFSVEDKSIDRKNGESSINGPCKHDSKISWYTNASGISVWKRYDDDISKLVTLFETVDIETLCKGE